MRSVFGKLLVWFLLTVFVSGMGFVLSTAVSVASESRQPPFGMLITLQLNEARNAYERGGALLLEETLNRFRTVMNAECFLADSRGIDLTTGADLRPVIVQLQQRSRLGVFGGEKLGFVRRSPDGLYWYILFIQRRNWLQWFFSLQHLWIFAIVLLLCYGFAFHLTSPLRNIQAAVDRFGRGDLAARAATSRRDELGSLAQTFNRMADRIQTLLAAERRLLLDISHELRSPLARLSLAVELARSGDDRDAALNRIQKEADRVNQLLTELLEVTRVEGDPSQRKVATVSIDELARAVVDDGSVEANARGCAIALDAPQPVTVDGDYELIRRALENVVRNAIRFSPKDTRVEVSVRTGNGSVLVQVRDYGPGVPEESLARIFDPFYRVESDRNRSVGGVGLGLSIAKRAVEAHRGTLVARNENPGLLVEMRIPRGPTAPAGARPDTPAGAQPAGSRETRI
jgi:signal transduction histidine kinase